MNIDKMQFDFTPGCGTTNAIFILRQLQTKNLPKPTNLHFAFVDLEKAFDRVPRDAVCWNLRKLGAEEWLVKIVQSIYTDPRSRKGLRVNGKNTKIMVSGENAGRLQEMASFLVLFAEWVQTVISSSTSFAGVRCIRDVEVSEVN